MQWFCSPRKSSLQRKGKKISKSIRKKSRMKQKGDINTEPSSPKLLIRKLERRKFGKLCYFEILENIQKVTVKRKASSKTCQYFLIITFHGAYAFIPRRARARQGSSTDSIKSILIFWVWKFSKPNNLYNICRGNVSQLYYPTLK